MSTIVENNNSSPEPCKSKQNLETTASRMTVSAHGAPSELCENNHGDRVILPSPVSAVLCELGSITSGTTGRVAVSEFIRLLTNPNPESGAPFPRGISPKDLFDYISKLPEDQRVSKTRNHLQVLLWRDVKLSKIQRVGTGVYTVPEFYDQIMQLKQIEGSNDAFFVRNDDLVDSNQKSKSGRKRSHEKSDQTGINVPLLIRETNGFPPNDADSDQNNVENPAKKRNKIDKTFVKQEFNEKYSIDSNSVGSQVGQDEDDRPPNLVANDQALDLSLIAKLKCDRNSVNGQSPPQAGDVEKSVNVVANCSQKRNRRSSNDQNKNTKRNLTKNGNAAKTSDAGEFSVNGEPPNQSNSDADSDSFVPIAHYKIESSSSSSLKVPKHTVVVAAANPQSDQSCQSSAAILIPTTDKKIPIENGAVEGGSNGKQVKFHDVGDGPEKTQRNSNNILKRRKRFKKPIDGQSDSTTPVTNGKYHRNDSPDVCFFCQSSQEGLDGRPEKFLCCFSCGFKAHPTCMGYCGDLAARCRIYDWQCSDCKLCCLCSSAENPESLLLCDECDRGYHTYCHKPLVNEKPVGKWSCKDCASLQTKPKISPKSEIEVTKRSILIQNTVESVGCSSGENSNQAGVTPNSHCHNQVNHQSNSQNLSLPFIDDNPLIKQAAKEAHGWNVEQVFSFISQLGFADQAIAFRREEIDGQALLLLKRSDVLSMLSLKLGPALKIHRRLSILQSLVLGVGEPNDHN